jgi:hypothetical protein
MERVTVGTGQLGKFEKKLKNMQLIIKPLSGTAYTDRFESANPVVSFLSAGVLLI